MEQRAARVVAHRRIARDHYQLTVRAPLMARTAQPGQFVHLLCGDTTLLRRPFSLFDADPRRGTCALIYKVVGRGTEVLRHVRVGAALDLLGPLGTHFTAGAAVRRAVLIGGGVGIPPLYLWAKSLVHRPSAIGKTRVVACLGARTREWMICAKAFRRLGVPVHLATDDGTLGHRGSVVEVAEAMLRDTRYASRETALYICGPTPMMQAAAALARRWHLPAQVSLEERMGCAMGVCMGCIVEIAGPHATAHKRFQRVCTEGPVFPAQMVVWRPH